MKTIDLHISDIVHNSLRAESSIISVKIISSDKDSLLSLTIKDNGKGIDSETLKKINSSYYSSRKERNIGMGLALLKFHAELCDGKFIISSKKGKGTILNAEFKKGHIDMQPLGDISKTIATFICQFEKVNFIFEYISDNSQFYLSSENVKEVFDNIDLNNSAVINELSKYINDNIN